MIPKALAIESSCGRNRALKFDLHAPLPSPLEGVWYERGSLNNRHVVNHSENAGHSVEYRGERVGQSLGQGFRGMWSK